MNSSPIFTESYSFAQALEKMLSGAWMTKMSWGDESIWIQFNEDDRLCIHKADGTLAPLIITKGDLHVDDWIEVGGDNE